MSQFLWKSALFLLGLIIFIDTLGPLVDRIAPVESSNILQAAQAQTWLLKNRSQVVNAVVIGNSHGGAIDLDVLGYQGYNLNRGFADAFENQYYLEQFVSAYPTIKTVFIPVSYFLSRWDNAASTELEIRRIYVYTATPAWQSIQGDWGNFAIGKLYSILPIRSITRWDSWKGVFVAMLGKLSNEGSGDTLPEQESDAGCTPSDPQALDQHAQERVTDVVNFTQEMQKNHPNLDSDVTAQMAATISYLHARQIRVVFFTPPYYRRYTELYGQNDADTITLTATMAQTLQQEYGVEYYDYSTDAQFVSDPQIFVDSDHLNPCGVKLFTSKLKRDLMQTTSILTWSESKHYGR